MDRFRKVKIRSAKRPVPDDQAYILAQILLDADRSETALLSNELRTKRAELERREKEKRNTAPAIRPIYYTALGQQVTSQSPYYRGYPYTYSHMYGAPLQTPSTSTTSVANPSIQVGGAIPVQLPVSSLPALHGLGIVPVPAASINSDVQPQPAAVLRGSSANGSMLNLEINVSLLQSSQMSGLAVILNSLMTKGSTPTAVIQTSPTANTANESEDASNSSQ